MNKIQCHDTILDLVGNTPLVSLQKIASPMLGHFFAKLEAFNPGHSAKDRTALYIINDAEKRGLLTPGGVIVETTSGNTGYSIAMIAAIRGYRCILAVTDKSSPDKIDMLRALGAEVHVCPASVAADDPRSYYEVAKRIHRETPNSIYINQYFNPLNTEAHYQWTGREIWEQTAGEITHLVACSGTGGTLSGIARYLKEKKPSVKIIGVDADGSLIKKYFDTGEVDKGELHPYYIEGLGKNLIPGALDTSVIDEFVKVNDTESALMARKISRTTGIFCGYTCGAAWVATQKYNQEHPFSKESVVVVVFPDHGSRYMNKIYNDQWLAEKLNIKD
ncbi:PLP-dependent cysteine synthase family protein [Capnocytophaga gingivalis]